MTSFRAILCQDWNWKKNQISYIKIAEISEFQLWPKIPLKLVIFFYYEKIMRFKKSLQ